MVDVSYADLRNMESSAPAHLKPILSAVRDHDCGLLMILHQSNDAFEMPNDGRPTIVWLGDDYDRAVGPEGFDTKSLHAALSVSTPFVISGEPIVEYYATAAAIAAFGRFNVVLIETRPDQRDAWAELIKDVCPGHKLAILPTFGTARARTWVQ